MNDAVERAIAYGVQVEGGQVTAAYHKQFDGVETLDWTSPRLKGITRMRLLSDPGLPFWDVAYVDGETTDGQLCKVQVPFSQLPYSANGKAMWRVMYEHGNRDKVHVNRLFKGCDISKLR